MPILNEGMGGFLNPPGHAEHDFCVRWEKDYLCLSHAVTCEYLPANLRQQARELLEKHTGTLTEEWVQQVYKYFARCYSPDGVDRNVSNCIVTKKGSTELPAEYSLAYLHIKQYFPEYSIRLDLLERE